MITEKIISFQKEVEKEIDGKMEKTFEECPEEEATYKLIRKLMKHRKYNQEFPTKRIKIENDKSK